jgi:hypothetical protein
VVEFHAGGGGGMGVERVAGVNYNTEFSAAGGGG